MKNINGIIAVFMISALSIFTFACSDEGTDNIPLNPNLPEILFEITLSESPVILLCEEGQVSQSVSFSVKNISGQRLSYSTGNSDNSIYEITPVGGVLDNGQSLSHAVQADCSSAESGVHKDYITFSSDLAGMSEDRIEIALTVSEAPKPPQLFADLSRTDFSCVIGSQLTGQATLTVSNGGDGEIQWDSSVPSFMLLSLENGTVTSSDSDTAAVLIDCRDMIAGNYDETLTISSQSAGTVDIPITLQVLSTPDVVLDPAVSLNFECKADEAVVKTENIEISIIGGQGDEFFSWQASDTESWMSLDKTSGTVSATPDVLTVSVDCSKVNSQIETYTEQGKVNVNYQLVGGNTQGTKYVDVYLTVKPATIDYPAVSYFTATGGDSAYVDHCEVDLEWYPPIPPLPAEVLGYRYMFRYQIGASQSWSSWNYDTTSESDTDERFYTPQNRFADSLIQVYIEVLYEYGNSSGYGQPSQTLEVLCPRG